MKLRLSGSRRLMRNRLTHGWMRAWMVAMMALPVVIGFGLIWKSWPLLQSHSIIHLLGSDVWRPLAGEFGFAPFVLSSLWVTLLALLIAGPVCVFSALHLTQYAPRAILRLMQPVIDILAGIPSVIYGVWGIVAIVPLVSETIAPVFGAQTSGYSILAGSLVLAVMIIPFILNILIDIFNSIPMELQEASLSLGASRWYTIKYVIMRKALPGVVSALGLGLSRAFGETIAVLMVVGNVADIPGGIFQPGYPLPALIANNYGEMLSIPMYDSALMLAALILFSIVILFNIAARLTIIRYEKISE